MGLVFSELSASDAMKIAKEEDPGISSSMEAKNGLEKEIGIK